MPARPYSQAMRIGPIAVSAGQGDRTADGQLSSDLGAQAGRRWKMYWPPCRRLARPAMTSLRYACTLPTRPALPR